MTSKDSIAAKIRALLAKTVENGATEHEAHAAAAKARQLMDQHQLSLSEVELREEGSSKIDFTFPDRLSRLVACELAQAVEAYTETTNWTNYGRTEIYFVGLASDIIFAEWLLSTLVNIIVRDAREYARQRRDRSLTMHFAFGATNRVRARMMEEVRARRAARAGTGLVVAKDAIIKAKLQEIGIELKQVPRETVTVDPFAAAAGAKAGDRVRWDKPIEKTEALRIG